MHIEPSDALVQFWLGVFFLLFVVQRVFELWLSARHARAMQVRGGTEFGRGHFPFLVLVHTLFPILLVAEVFFAGARPAAWPIWLALWVLAELLRCWAISSLGTYWNVRIWVVPGVDPVRGGPYRFLRHPNYLAVAIELVAAPMMFGAWRTACIISALNLIALAVRIPREEEALRWARLGFHAKNQVG